MRISRDDVPMLNLIEHGDILEIQLARPPVNALNPELLTRLCAALADAAARGTAGLVLSGGPSVFSAGLDVPYLLTLDRPALAAAWGSFFKAMEALARTPMPVVAAIGGHSPAGGAVLALCCDYRIMVPGDGNAEKPRAYTIGLNEVQVGLVVPEGVQYLMRRTIGGYRAERLLVAGTMLTAAQAHHVGLVDELAEADALRPRALEWLRALLALPRAPMLTTRRMARADLIEAACDPRRIDLDHFLDDWFGEDTQRALKAMVARVKKPG